MKNKLRIIGVAFSLAFAIVASEGEVGAISSSPTVTTIAGQKATSGSTDGAGTAASFSFSAGITTDGTYLYIADTFNHTIRKIVISTATVTTIAGAAGVSGSGDGIKSDARFNTPQGITTDGTYLYVADTNNNIIRKIDLSTGFVSILAGKSGVFGFADGVGQSALFGAPSGITTDGDNLYVADTGNSTIRKIVISTGEVIAVAGKAGEIGSFDGYGSSARFNYPVGITCDGTNLFVVDTGNSTIRQIVIASREVNTLAGIAGTIGSTDGTAGTALFNYPLGITSDGANLYVTDNGNATIRRIVISSGDSSTLMGAAEMRGASDGKAAVARFNIPSGIATVGTGTTVYITDMGTIRQLQ